jgi:hypothetical protein
VALAVHGVTPVVESDWLTECQNSVVTLSTPKSLSNNTISNVVKIIPSRHGLFVKQIV